MGNTGKMDTSKNTSFSHRFGCLIDNLLSGSVVVYHVGLFCSSKGSTQYECDIFVDINLQTIKAICQSVCASLCINQQQPQQMSGHFVWLSIPMEMSWVACPSWNPSGPKSCSTYMFWLAVIISHYSAFHKYVYMLHYLGLLVQLVWFHSD